MEVNESTRKGGIWILGAAFALQVLIVPWRAPVLDPFAPVGPATGYAPIWSPTAVGATIEMGHLLITLGATGLALLVWLKIADTGDAAEEEQIRN